MGSFVSGRLFVAEQLMLLPRNSPKDQYMMFLLDELDKVMSHREGRGGGFGMIFHVTYSRTLSCLGKSKS